MSFAIFSQTQEVGSTSGTSGYIRTTDIALAQTTQPCYEQKISGNCLYYKYELEELQYTAKEHCGSTSSNQQIIEKRGEKCERDSNDEEKCQQCYLVNESNWNIIKTELKFSPFSLGNFKVNYPHNAKIIGAGKYEQQLDTTHKEHLEYIFENSKILVAGNSDGQAISHNEDENQLIISTLNYEGTYNALKKEDSTRAWIFCIVALNILIFGYLLIFGPISVMSNFVRKIPLLGKWIDNAVGGIILLASIVLGIVHFIIVWILIMLLKNIILIAVLIALGGIAFYIYTRFRQPNNA